MQLSRQLLAFAFLFVLLFAALPSFTSAQDDDVDADATKVEVESEYEEESEVAEELPQQYVMPAEDVRTVVKFLGVNENKFVAGDEVIALIGMTNLGPKTYNVSYVGAHLHSPIDFNFYVQNFSVIWTSSLLPPHSEVTVQYKFRPDEKLEPFEFHLSGWLIYNDSTVPTPIIYRNLFVNQTIEILEKRSEWTVQSTFTFLLTLAGIGIAGYVVLSQTSVGKKIQKSATAKSGASGENASASWEAKIYKPSNVQKAVGSKKGAKKQ